ncbi:MULTISPECIES: conjugal transfer protein MobB [Sphingobacterium]|uniref:conjugal transfer protein MobB n=1 Tax=Sphingobacterium TaxID=28453 RepID=UPI000DB82C09|nr:MULTISPECIES: conjugal transfer protein MobB [Sphingobacterium]PZU25978.1 MAG: relaxase [Chryseobacterium sp.]
MIAKIGRSSNLYGALAYNNLKVEKEDGQILMFNKIIENRSGSYSAGELSKSFEPYLIANRNTEKHTLHISLNPDPKDAVSDEKFKEMALKYMKEMGYGDQPFIVFKHTDIDRTHIHIVSVCVDENGRKISDKFEKRRSMQVCRDLESKYGLIPATEKEYQHNDRIFKPVDYKVGKVKSQIVSVIRHLPKYYKFQTLGEYNALLSLFNITTEKVEGELNGKMQKGLLYFPLNDKGEKAGSPFKASLFGKSASLNSLELYFGNCKALLTDSPVELTLKAAVANAIKTTINEEDFRRNLVEQGINMVLRRNSSERIYGITFIDHNSRTVWNGSRLGKEYSANIFNNLWKNDYKPYINKSFESPISKPGNSESSKLYAENIHHLFDFLLTAPETDNYEDTIIDTFGGLLPEAQGEDFEELQFANKMKKRRKII